jgi:hypothetical protein
MFTYCEGHIYMKTRAEDVLCIPEVKLGEYTLRGRLFKPLSNYYGSAAGFLKPQTHGQ